MRILLYAMVIIHFYAINAAPLNLDLPSTDLGPRRPAQAGRDPSEGEKGVSPLVDHLLDGLISDSDATGKSWDLISPRVTLSSNAPLGPPLLFLMEDYVAHPELANRTSRVKRAEGNEPWRRGDVSVCDSISQWVTDKESAVDIRGKTVKVLSEVQTLTGPLKQYFFETKCNLTGSTSHGCRGVDKRHWVSQCKAKQSFVRALTINNEKQAGWRWIRIDTSCVCVLVSRSGKT
ncbi:neurotrophin-4-like [Latimeria chalumnae]|uniref:Neurotrophin-4 n=1 Tax=Latimeria chalumnae TaxID=7897 RepID=H3A863_LATCH|nr:PREDICTED: neurotrophin-4-like [Latimeria chalumnae]|eukprot:XP_006012921.1 PREDICTED: neurotrophin-4-like [Latimeria chalumnae]